MYLTNIFSLYPFAVPKPDFLYKTSSLKWGGGGGHQFSRRKQILVGIDLKYIYALKIMLITMTFDSIMFPLVILFYIV